MWCIAISKTISNSIYNNNVQILMIYNYHDCDTGVV